MTIDVFSFFLMKLGEISNRSTAESYRKAINSLRSFAPMSNFTFEMMNESFLSEWIVWLIQKGYTKRTIAYYLKQISALYNKASEAGITHPSDVLGKLRRRVLSISDTSFDIVDLSIVSKLQSFFRERTENSAISQLASDIVAFAILNGGMTFDQIASFKKNDRYLDDDRLTQIVTRYSKPRNTYLFPLHQSNRTPCQMRKDLGVLFYVALTPYGITLSPSVEYTALNLWCDVALTCSEKPSVLRSAVKPRLPIYNPALDFIKPDDVSEEDVLQIQRSVIDALYVDSENWYAMQFRPHVGYNQILQELKACSHIASFSELFYPCEEIMRRTGKTLKKRKKPIMPGLLFFKSRATDVDRVFRYIGHLAWCYRQTNCKSSPYAIITQKEMLNYQTVIGQFSSDEDVVPEGTLDISEKDYVIMMEGSFVGIPAIVEAIKHKADVRIICKLSLIGSNRIEWVVNADSRMVKKISEHYYNQLIHAKQLS